MMIYLLIFSNTVIKRKKSICYLYLYVLWG